MPQDRLRSPRGGHGRRTTALSDFEFRVWDQYQLSADDFGVLRCSAINVQADNDNLADRPSADVQAALERLIEVELVACFEHQGRRYLSQLDWQTFQKVEYPRATTLPKPSEAILARCDAPTRRLFGKHPGGWRKGKKGSGNRSDETPERVPKVSRTTSDETLEGLPDGSPEGVPTIPHKPLAVSNSSSKSREPDPPPSALERAMDAWRSHWQQAYGFEPSLLLSPIEQMKLEQQLAAIGEARFIQAITAYFATEDVFVRNAKHPLPLFLKDPLKHLAGSARAAQGRPRGCKHEPACGDDAAHTKRDMADRRVAS